MTIKERLHQLVDQLPESELVAAERALADSFPLALLNTPEGEEPLSVEEIAGIIEGKREQASGRVRRFSNPDALIDELHNEAGH